MDAIQILKINNDDLDEILAEFDATTPTGQRMRNLKLFIDDPFDPRVTVFEADVFTVYNRAVDELNRPDPQHPHGRANLLAKVATTSISPMTGSSEFATQTFSALANIIIDRAKTEFTIAYFDRLKNVLDNTELQFDQKKTKLKNIFPKSFQQLSTINLLDYHSSSQLIQNAFKEDLLALPENLHDHLIPDAVKSDIKYRLFRIGSSFVRRAQEGSSIPDVFNEIKADFAGDAAYTDITPVINLVTILSENLRVDDIDGRYWVKRAELLNLGPDGQKYLIGLIHLRNRDVFNSFLGRVDPSQLYQQKQKIIDFISLLEGLDQELRDVRNNGNIASIAANYSRILMKAFNAYGNASRIYDIGDTPDIAPVFRDAQDWIKLGFDAAQAIRDENYGPLVFTAINILQKAGFTDMQNEAFSKAIRFASFSADMLNAKTAEEKQKVLDDVISPPTTYRTKRSYAKTTFINSYLGLSGGREWLSRRDSWAGHAGLFAPIGIELAAATKNDHSNSLLFSVVDLGTIVSYRISNTDDSDGVPEDFNLKSIVSPGLFYVHGFANSPISLGFGGQFAGDLRKTTEERNSAIRLTAFLAVDIPLFQISAKQK
jgi:hypothetical protein